jgi:hypothetical protein
MPKNLSASRIEEKRVEPRAAGFKNYRIEIKLAGTPIYQFKVNDVSIQGAGLLINEDSKFLEMIDVGQTVEANFISPHGANPTGMYRVEIIHISRMDKGRYKKFRLIGIRIHERLHQS